LLLLTPSLPLGALLGWVGVAYSMMSTSLWPGVAYVVPRSRLGTAYGLMNTFQNFGSGTMSLVVGAIFEANTTTTQTRCNSTNASYYSVGTFSTNGTASANCTTTHTRDTSDHRAEPALMLFMVSSGIAVALCCWNYVVDKRDNGMLNATPAKREEIARDPEHRTSGNFNIDQIERPFFDNSSVQTQTTMLNGALSPISEGPPPKS